MKKQLMLLVFLSCQVQAALPPEYRLQRDNNAKAKFVEAHPLIKQNLINEKTVSYYFPTPYGDKVCQVTFTRNHPAPQIQKNNNGTISVMPAPVSPAPDLSFHSSNCPITYTELNKHLSHCRHAQATPRHVLGSTKNDHDFHKLPICKRPNVSDSELTKDLTKLLDSALAIELTPDRLKETSVQKAFDDLNGDGLKEAIVHLKSPEFCGSGGCDTHVYQLDIVNNKLTYQPISRIVLSKTPIYVLDNKTNGWYDIAVHISGGGMTPQAVALKFHKQVHTVKNQPKTHDNAKKHMGYPSNPTSSKHASFIQKLSGKPKGVLAIK